VGELVQLTIVGSEAEAATLAGYLASRGIQATYDKGGVDGLLPAYMGANSGPQEILVHARDLDAARAALAEQGVAP
jgi:hypothetical protein